VNISALRVLVGDAIFTVIPGTVFWPWFAGLVILVVGVFATWKEVALARGQEKIVTLGRLFFAIPMAVFAAQHFTETKPVSTIVPSWLPWHIFWTLFVGAALIAAALSIVVKKQARLAAILLGAMLIMFVLLLHIPSIMAKPKEPFRWAIALRDLAFSGGAFAFAGAQTAEWRAKGTNALITVARIFISVTSIYFGVAHFVHPECLPGIDLDQRTPTWIVGHGLWPYIAGVIFLVAGTSMLLNRKTRLAATSLGFMALVLLVFVYLPMVVSKPSDINNGLNYFVSTLAFGGAAFLLAAAIPANRDTVTQA
jgi:uncharacterized membrane protein